MGPDEEQPPGDVQGNGASFSVLFKPPERTQAPSPERTDQIDARRRDLKDRREHYELRSFAAFCVATMIMLFGVPLIGIVTKSFLVALMVAVYGLAVVGLGLLNRHQARGLTEDITELSNERDLIELFEEPDERRATKLHQVNQFDLKRYYDQTLRQGNQIFYVGVLCILLGFGVIAAALLLIRGNALSTDSERIIVAALGAVGGVLSNFIAIVYLRMFSTTIESVGKFHQRLVVRDRLNFANILTAKIDSGAVRETTLAQMAVELAIDRELGRAKAATNGGAEAHAPS